MNNSHFALIMAGGQGTRFWPWSTPAQPKQFLPVIGDQPLISQTFNRLRRFIAADHIFIVADPQYRAITLQCLPELQTDQYIAEPAPRNTAPCLMLANIRLAARAADATLLVVPADHYIADEEIFARQMSAAMAYAEEPCIVTAGITPTSPHTGYGYIQFAGTAGDIAHGETFLGVTRFKEKPNRETALQYLADGHYLWNSGMFIYKLSHFRAFMQTYAPDYFAHYQALEAAGGDPAKEAIVFQAIKPDSIDYVLMEKVREMRMFKAAFPWNDVGSWTSVYEMNTHDERHNVSRGQTVLIDTQNTLVFATDERPVAVIGLTDTAVISTANGVLIAKLDALQQVKEVIAQLKKK